MAELSTEKKYFPAGVNMIDPNLGRIPGDDSHTDENEQQTPYSRASDAYYAARREAGAQLLASSDEMLKSLTQQPFGLRDRIALTVRWGVAVGLVHIEPETRLAYAQQAFEQVPPSVLQEQLDVEAGGDEEEARLQHEMCGVPVFATHEEMRAYDDLWYALETGYGQSIALYALENPSTALLEEADESDELASVYCVPDEASVGVATDLLARIGLIAEERFSPDAGMIRKTRFMPRKIYEEFLPFVEAEIRRYRGTNQPDWFHDLVDRFKQPLRGKTDKEAVDRLLPWLGTYEGDSSLPTAFRRRDPAHIDNARKLIRTLRVDIDGVGDAKDDSEPWFGSDVPVYVPDRLRRGRPVKPWTAAALFCRCFGCRTPPLRERDARRRA